MVQAITAAPKFDQQQHGNENVPTAAKQKHTFIFQNCSRTLASRVHVINIEVMASFETAAWDL